MTVDKKLITKIVDEGLYPEAKEYGVKPTFFTTDQDKEVFSELGKHFDKYGNTPTRERLKRKFPDYEFMETRESVAELSDDLRDKARTLAGRAMIAEAAQTYKTAKKGEAFYKAGTKVLSDLKKHLFSLEEEFSQDAELDMNSTEFKETFIKDYYERKQRGGVADIEWPWPSATMKTQGIEPSDLIVVTARAGCGKSWLLVAMAEFWIKAGKKVLFVSPELSLMSLAYRVVSKMLRIPYGDLRGTRVEDIESHIKPLDDQPGGLILVGNDGDMSSGGVSSIESKFLKHQPDIILVDGGYLLDDDLGGRDKYERAGNVIRSLKKLNKRRKTPIVVSWQLNRAAESGNITTANLGLSDTVGSDSSYILAITQTEDQKLNKQNIVDFIKCREAPKFILRINWDFQAMDYSEIGLVGEEDEELDELPEEEAL